MQPPAAPSDHQKESPGIPAVRTILWVGSATGQELVLARSALAAFADVATVEHPHDAGRVTQPTLAVLASDRPGRFTTADAVSLSRRWPLMPIVSVAATLVDGRRRSGPQLPGIEEVPWHDLAGRCSWWLAALEAGLPTGLGMPHTSRREDRLLESITALRGGPEWAAIDVSVAAARPVELEGLCDLLAVAGHRVVHRSCGRPRIDESAAAVVWDNDAILADQIAWLRLLAANRPHVGIVMLESFPRGDTAAAAMQSGAEAVLGRPVCIEALAGTLLRLKKPHRAGNAGLGRHPGGR